jgi:hypothetical protein
MLKKLLLLVRVYFVAYIPLFLALGGTSYAASSKPGNPFIQGSGHATFGRLALEGGPPLGANTPMATILSVKGFGDVLMYCSTDATPTTAGGFAFQNTTSEPVVVSGFGTLQPGQRTFGGEGNMRGTTSEASTFQVTSEFDQPDRIATVIVSGIVEGNVCRGHAHAIAQPAQP